MNNEVIEAAVLKPESRRSTKSQFVRIGNMYRMAPTTDFTSMLPVGVYSLGFSSQDGFFLEVSDSFVPPPKIYGESVAIVERILHTYLDRNFNTGILLQGEKGSGKSLIARLVSIRASALNVPTILINAPFSGEAFNEFLSEITQRTVVIFDEFEKVYQRDKGHQIGLLSLLDGMRPSNKLFIFTTNEFSGIEYHLENRPGRIFYSITFSGLSEQFIRDFLVDRLIEKSRIEEVVLICNIIGKVNFDMLAALVEEMNRYKESARDALRYMNIRAENNYQYALALEVNGEPCGAVNPTRSENLLTMQAQGDEPPQLLVMDVTAYNAARATGNEELMKKTHRPVYLFSPRHFVGSKHGEFEFYNPEKHARLRMTRVFTYERSAFSYV